MDDAVATWMLCLGAFLLGAAATWLLFVRPARAAGRPDRPVPGPPTARWEPGGEAPDLRPYLPGDRARSTTGRVAVGVRVQIEMATGPLPVVVVPTPRPDGY